MPSHDPTEDDVVSIGSTAVSIGDRVRIVDRPGRKAASRAGAEGVVRKFVMTYDKQDMAYLDLDDGSELIDYGACLERVRP